MKGIKAMTEGVEREAKFFFCFPFSRFEMAVLQTSVCPLDYVRDLGEEILWSNYLIHKSAQITYEKDPKLQ